MQKFGPHGLAHCFVFTLTILFQDLGSRLEARHIVRGGRQAKDEQGKKFTGCMCITIYIYIFF